MRHVQYVVIDGNRVWIWYDAWCGQQPLEDLYIQNCTPLQFITMLQLVLVWKRRLIGGHAIRILGLFEMLMTGNWSRLTLCLICYTQISYVVRVLPDGSGD